MKSLIIIIATIFILTFILTDAFGIGNDDDTHEGGIHP